MGHSYQAWQVLASWQPKFFRFRNALQEEEFRPFLAKLIGNYAASWDGSDELVPTVLPRRMPEGCRAASGDRCGRGDRYHGATLCLVLVSGVCVVVAVGDSACSVPLVRGLFNPAGPSSVRPPAEGCS